jgi:signal transduction histidine kinase
MKSAAAQKLIGLVFGMVLMGAAIVFLTTRVQTQSAQLRLNLERVDSEGFRIADELFDPMRQLNDSLYHYGQSHVAPNRDAFEATSQDLDHWIERQTNNLTTLREVTIMQQIDRAYHEYLRVARDLLVRLEAIGDESASIDEYTNLRNATHRLFLLRKALARAHQASREQFLREATSTIAQIRILTLVSLGSLFLFAIVVSAVVYREMIVPLRLKLVESEALRERQEKLASLGVLAAGVAHEIRNPLTAIKGALFIQQKHCDPGTQTYAETKVVEREILRLERIVNDFLLFARPREPKFTRLPAEAPLSAVHALLASPLAKSGLQLVLDPVPTLHVEADEDQIKEVLINLVRNAAEASAAGGIIRLRARADQKRLKQKLKSVVVLEVEDHGKGIPAAVQKRLFDPFFTTKDSGTGLGLSIAARIVQSHGGMLEYQTAPGHGTTFGVVLPETGS